MVASDTAPAETGSSRTRLGRPDGALRRTARGRAVTARVGASDTSTATSGTPTTTARTCQSVGVMPAAVESRPKRIRWPAKGQTA